MEPEAAARPAPPDPRRDARRLVRLGVVVYAVLALVALAWRNGLYGEPILYADPAAAARGVRPLTDALWGLALAALSIALSDLWARTASGERMARALAEAVGPLTVGQCLVLALASGIAEEMFFRGALQPRVGLLWASLLFGAAHFVPSRDLVWWSAMSVLAGLALGWLYQHTGNLIAPVVAHVTINAVNLPRMVRRYWGPVAPPRPPPR